MNFVVPSHTANSATISLTAYTPPASTITMSGNEETATASSSIPWPGSTYIIQNVATSKVLTFQSSAIVLRRLVSHASIRWNCVSNEGWVGFKDPASDMYLGYDRSRNHELICSARVQKTWENFCIQHCKEGEYVLLMPCYDSVGPLAWQKLRPLGITQDGKVGIVKNWADTSIAWRFIKVEDEKEDE